MPSTTRYVVGNLRIVLLALAVMLALCAPAHAAGTAAGTRIGNRATLSYSSAGAPVTITAVAPTVLVARVISVVVSWQDGAPVPASSPDPARPATFLVTNTGNGADTFRLARNDAVPGDQFDPAAGAGGGIWVESGAEAGFQASGPNADIPYTAGLNDLALPADGSRIVYAVSSIPAGFATGATGKTTLTATTTAPHAGGAAPGSALGAIDGVPAVVGAGAGQGSATGIYLVGGVSLGLAKTVTGVKDPLGGQRVMSGAVLTYRIVLTFTGDGVADAVSVNDPLPSELSYVPGSLAVDGAARTDAEDGDGASFAAGAVSASFGSVRAPSTRVIEFKATLN
jgi:uncharacterized repeat protein (TIGR01451 family)